MLIVTIRELRAIGKVPPRGAPSELQIRQIDTTGRGSGAPARRLMQEDGYLHPTGGTNIVHVLDRIVDIHGIGGVEEACSNNPPSEYSTLFGSEQQELLEMVRELSETSHLLNGDEEDGLTQRDHMREIPVLVSAVQTPTPDEHHEP